MCIYTYKEYICDYRRHYTTALFLHLTYISIPILTLSSTIIYILYEEHMKYRKHMSSIFQCTGNESERMSICVDFTDNLILSYLYLYKKI